MITKEQKEYLLPMAFNAALRAGAAILEIYEGEQENIIDIKSDSSPITLADRRAHTVIKEYLARTRIPLLSEEGREMLYTERKDWDLFWMVDPLDGTKEFLKGNGEFTVNIALMVDNRPAFGVVYVPYKERIYFSDSDMGAFRRCGAKADPDAGYSYGQLFDSADPLPVAAERNMPLRVAISRSHNTPETFEIVERMRVVHPGMDVREQGSSYKFCLIAEGAVDFYPRTSDTYEWDTAAGEAILAAAGGSTLTLNDGPVNGGFSQGGSAGGNSSHGGEIPLNGGLPLEYNKESLVNPHFACRSKWFK